MRRLVLEVLTFPLRYLAYLAEEPQGRPSEPSQTAGLTFSPRAESHFSAADGYRG